MATIKVNESNFAEVAKKPGIVLLDWWAAWCGPCRNFGPVFERVSDKHPEMTFAKVDTEEARELAGAFNIRSIPTLMVIRDGVMVYSQAGALREADLENLITQVQGLDMEQVRKEVGSSDPASVGA